MAFLEDMTHEQVAEALDVPLGTAKTRIRTGLHSLRTVLAPVAATLFGLGFAVVGVRAIQTQTAVDRDQQALSLVVMSDVTPRRLSPVMSGLPAGAHATFRGHVGSDIAVLSAEALPTPQSGDTYQAWAQVDGQWSSLGTVVPDAQGSALLIAQGSALASAPAVVDAVEVTLQQGTSAQTPGDAVVLRWQPV